MELIDITLKVNGTEVALTRVEPRITLADLLREQLQLRGTRLGCEHGVCGACTLLLDGEPVRACLTLAVACADREVTTVEGLNGVEIDALRASFSAEHALQCGFCTAGMLITARDLLRREPAPTEDRVRSELAGNICRCTGYAGIVRACLSASARLRANSSTPSASTETASDAL